MAFTSTNTPLLDRSGGMAFAAAQPYRQFNMQEPMRKKLAFLNSISQFIQNRQVEKEEREIESEKSKAGKKQRTALAIGAATGGIGGFAAGGAAGIGSGAFTGAQLGGAVGSAIETGDYSKAAPALAAGIGGGIGGAMAPGDAGGFSGFMSGFGQGITDPAVLQSAVPGMEMLPFPSANPVTAGSPIGPLLSKQGAGAPKGRPPAIGEDEELDILLQYLGGGQ